jgi:predicted transcriptional regulator
MVYHTSVQWVVITGVDLNPSVAVFISSVEDIVSGNLRLINVRPKQSVMEAVPIAAKHPLYRENKS